MSDLYRKINARSDRWRERNDCTVKALAIATGKTYEQAHGAMALRGRNFRKGVTMSVCFQAARDLGFTEKEVFCRHFSERDHYFAPDKEKAKKYRRSRWAKGKTIKSIKPFLPKRGAYLIQTSTHVLCVRAGEIHDWTNDRRHRIIKVHHITKKESGQKK